MEPVIGIDLGTTFSCVAFMNGDVPTVISNKGGYLTTPSIVAFSKEGKRLVGHVAKRQAVANPANTIYAAKRLIGRKWGSDTVQKIRSTVPYAIAEGPGGSVVINVLGETYSVSEISSYILQEMKMVAEAHLNTAVSKCVITVPAYFNNSQRQATREAGMLAGLEVLRIVNEPTAASLAYGYRKDMSRRLAVYDLGGGTFDISILDVNAGEFKVVASSGDSFLGGEDFDLRLSEHLGSRFKAEHGIDISADPVAAQRLKEASEKAKCDLSTLKETEVSLPFIATKPGGDALHMKRQVTRDELESLVDDLVEKSLFLCEKILEEERIPLCSIEDVLLVGGQTRMPLVRQRVKEFFGKEPSKKVHPDEAVALGAAIYAHSVISERTGISLLDVTPQALGIPVSGGFVRTMIEKNTPVPFSRRENFTTVRDNQAQIRIAVLQGDSRIAGENDLLGEFVLDGLKPALRGQTVITVDFSIDVDGIVHVSAVDEATGRKKEIMVTAKSGLDEEEKRKVLEKNIDHLLEVKEDDEASRFENEILSMVAILEMKLKAIDAIPGKVAGPDGEMLKKSGELLEKAKAAAIIGDQIAMRSIMGRLNGLEKLVEGIARKKIAG